MILMEEMWVFLQESFAVVCGSRAHLEKESVAEVSQPQGDSLSMDFSDWLIG